MQPRNKKLQKGFTLIELLIVIGLLGALTSLILPSLTASREDALLDVCDYNQAGTARVLTQYTQLYGVLPDQMHTGLAGNAAVDRSNLMPMPTLGAASGDEEAMAENYVRATSSHQLTANQAASLIAAGINNLAYDAYTMVTPATDVYVAKVDSTWVDDGGDPFTFRGRSLDDLGVGATSPDGILIPLWIAPTVNWESGYGSASDWAGKADLQLKIDLEGACPIPTDADFSYYVAFVKAFNNGDPAELIGTSCPECGVMNP